MKTRTVRISSCFPASAETIWEKLQRVETLQYIAAPFASFKSADGGSMVWKEGVTARFRLKIFGFLPMGVHTIKVVQFDKTTLSVYTNESNNSVPVWNHRITLMRESAGLTHYSDEVEIYAEWKTPFVYLWSKAFYRHRQKKWLRLLK
jgi:hypothetical protein